MSANPLASSIGGNFVSADVTLSMVRSEQVQRWRSRDRPPVEEFLGRFPGLAADTEAVMVLIYGEVTLREELDGTLPEPSEYTTRFPNLAEELMSQFALHGALSGRVAPPQLPGFDIHRELGRGGMGVVYLAHDRALRRPVAIKVLISGEYASETARARFRNEAEAAARLKHPNIIEVFSLGEHEGRPYLVQEYVAGGSLDQRLDGTPLDARTAAEMIRSLADAVHHAHAAGILHRDLKPANVLMSGEQTALVTSRLSLATVKIADFGLAKQLDVGDGPTKTSQVLGTPSYMAPEQAKGAKDSGPAVDIYALGAIFYECLTGRPPFKAATPLETLTQSLNEEPVAPRALNPTVPRDLETVCLKCLAKEPDKRYGAASALSDDLARFLEGRPVIARPVGALGRACRWAKRRPAIAGLIAALILVIGGAIAGLSTLYISADRDRRAAEANLVEARANLHVAVDAIDRYFVRVSDDGRLKEHDLRALRQSLLQSAVEFHEQLLTRHADDPQLQAELAKSLSRLGLLTGEIDAKPRAIDYYLRAVAEFDRLRLTNPSEPLYRQELAECYVGLGQLCADTAALDRATAAFGEARRLIDGLIRDEPANPDYRRQLAALCRRHGAYFRAHSRAAEAETLLREAVAVCEQLVKENPDNVVDCSALAESYSNLGYLFHYVLIRRWHEAETAYRQALTIQEEVVRRAPANPDYRNVLGRMCRDLGKICMLDRRTDESERAYKRGIDVHNSLARDHPNISSYQMVLTSLYKELGVVYDTTGRLADAVAPWQESLRCAERLVDRDPTDLRHVVSLGEMQSMLGYLQFRLHNDALDAATLVNPGIATLESAYARDSRLQTLQICLKNAYDFRGDILVSLGRYSEALADRERVITLAEPPFRPFAQIVHAVTLAQSGNDRRAIEEMRTAADAVPRNSPSAGAIYANSARVFAAAAIVVGRDAGRSDPVRKKLAESYSVQAVEWLWLAFEVGYPTNDPILKLPEFQPLRSRADYQAAFSGR